MSRQPRSERPTVESAKALLAAATNGGDWRVRQGMPADRFAPDGYRYVQFGPTEKAAAGLGTDQLAPADAKLIVVAVGYLRGVVAIEAATPAPLDAERLVEALAAVDHRIAVEFPEEAVEMASDQAALGRRSYAEAVATEYAALRSAASTGASPWDDAPTLDAERLAAAIEDVLGTLERVVTDAESQHPGGWGPDVTTVADLRDCQVILRAALAASPADPPRDTGGELDAAYRERNALVAGLIRVGGYKAEVVMAPDTEGWWIVYVETPAGQLSWHVSPDDMDLFSDWPVAFGTHRSPWDGHTTDEKYRRLARLAADQEGSTE